MARQDIILIIPVMRSNNESNWIDHGQLNVVVVLEHIGTPRLSTNTRKHSSQRSLCLHTFDAAFGGVLSERPLQQLHWGERGPPSCFLSRLVGCLFL